MRNPIYMEQHCQNSSSFHEYWEFFRKRRWHLPLFTRFLALELSREFLDVALEQIPLTHIGASSHVYHPWNIMSLKFHVESHIQFRHALSVYLYILKHPLMRIMCSCAREKKQSVIEEIVLDCRRFKSKTSTLSECEYSCVQSFTNGTIGNFTIGSLKTPVNFWGILNREPSKYSTYGIFIGLENDVIWHAGNFAYPLGCLQDWLLRTALICYWYHWQNSERTLHLNNVIRTKRFGAKLLRAENIILIFSPIMAYRFKEDEIKTTTYGRKKHWSYPYNI